MGVPTDPTQRSKSGPAAVRPNRFLVLALVVLSVTLFHGSASQSSAQQVLSSLPDGNGESEIAANGHLPISSAIATDSDQVSPESAPWTILRVQHAQTETPQQSPPAEQHPPGIQEAPSQEAQPHEAPQVPPQVQPSPKSRESKPPAAPSPAHPKAAVPEAAKPEHPAPQEALGEHGAAFPEISPIPGVTFVETMINLMDHELHGRTLGWRPNDIIIGRFTDDVNNYQLGVLEALRFTTLRLKDSLTRMGDADAYDPDLEQALNLFMNRATLFWFPSAEGSYGEAIDHLKSFVQKLKTGRRNFYYRVDNLRSLLSAYKDLLGNVNRGLIQSPVSWFVTDDSFYYAKGVAHVYYEILRVVRVGYQSQLASTLNALDIMDEIIHELHRADRMDPWIILDSDLDGLFANHRANINAPLSEVAHLLGVLSSF